MKNRLIRSVISAAVGISMIMSMVTFSYAGDEGEEYEPVRIEGADMSSASGSVIPTTETWDGGKLTVGKIRKNPADAESENCYSAYSFNIDNAGVYSMSVSANRWDLTQYSSYAIRIDDGEYITVSNGTVKNIGTYDKDEHGSTAAYALRSFEMKDRFYLEAGEHTLYIKAVTNSYNNGVSNGITVYFNYAEFTAYEPGKEVTVNGNEYTGVSEPDSLNIIGVANAPTVTLFKGNTLPEDGIEIYYSFFADYEGYYDIELSAGNYNNVYLSRSSVAVDDGEYMRIDSLHKKNMRRSPAQEDMCIYTMNEPVYLTAGKHSFTFKITDICINNVYEYFEYVKFGLKEDFGVGDVYVVNADNEKIYALSEADSVNGYVRLENYTEAPKTVTILAALYSNSRLSGLKTKTVTVPSGTQTDVYTEDIELDTQKAETLSIAVWESFETTEPITDNYVISENGVDNSWYDEDLAMLPMWDGKRTYNETIILVSETGQVSDAEGELLHIPEKIISVTSADKKTVYKEGIDWEYADGKLKLTENSRAPYLTDDELYGSGVEGLEFWNGVSKHILYTETTFWHEHQLAVTYDHEEQITENIPQYAGDILSKTAAKLSSGEDVSIVLNGDSISTGANMSGFKLIEPYMPVWGELFCNNLTRKFNSDIIFHNTSRGARTSVWALEEVDRNITRLKPDLAIIAFGMNDASGAMRKDAFKKNIADMIDAVRAESSDTEFILVSGIAANPDAANVGMTIPELRQGLYELAEEYEGVAVADVTAVHQMLLEKKKYIDLTGNNINHINDYMGRWYAQILSAMLIDNTQ